MAYHPRYGMKPMEVLQLENTLQYRLRDYTIIYKALYGKRDDDCKLLLDRLEFLGDALLHILVCKHMYTLYPDVSAGTLTDLKSAAVNNEQLSIYTVQSNLAHCLKKRVPNLTFLINRISAQAENASNMSGVSGKRCILADLFEAIVGAIYVDMGYDMKNIEQALHPFVNTFQQFDPYNLPKNPFRLFQEAWQQRGLDAVISINEHENGMTTATCTLFSALHKDDNGRHHRHVLKILEGVPQTSSKAARNRMAIEMLKYIEENIPVPEERLRTPAQEDEERKKMMIETDILWTKLHHACQTSGHEPSFGECEQMGASNHRRYKDSIIITNKDSSRSTTYMGPEESRKMKAKNSVIRHVWNLMWPNIDIDSIPIPDVEIKCASSSGNFKQDKVEEAAEAKYIRNNRNFKFLESFFQYTFIDKDPLFEALYGEVHPNKKICKRMEFLGDGVLNILASTHMFQTFEDGDSGLLTNLKSIATNNGTLSRFVQKNLEQCFQHRVEENLAKDPSMQFVPTWGSEKRQEILANLLEIVVGAIYVDTEYNLQRTQMILKPLLSTLFTITPEDIKLTPIRECQERSQQKRMNVYQECEQFGNGTTIATGVLVYKAKPFEIICTVRSDPKTAKSAALNNMAQKLLPHIQKAKCGDLYEHATKSLKPEHILSSIKRQLQYLCISVGWSLSRVLSTSFGSEFDKLFQCTIVVTQQDGEEQNYSSGAQAIAIVAEMDVYHEALKGVSSKIEMRRHMQLEGINGGEAKRSRHTANAVHHDGSTAQSARRSVHPSSWQNPDSIPSFVPNSKC